MTAPAKSLTLAEALGALLQDQRQRQAFTQAELAEQAGLSPKYVGQVERGEANVTLRALERLIDALGCQPSTLFDTTRPPLSHDAQLLLLRELGKVGSGLQRIVLWLTACDSAAPSAVPSSLDKWQPPSADATRDADERTSRD